MENRLQPHVEEGKEGEAPAAPALPQYRLVVRNVKCTTEYVYMAYFSSIDPRYQVHVPIKDHRMPFTEAAVVLHKWHPLIAGLQRNPRLRFLVRVKQEGEPLADMCGCC